MFSSSMLLSSQYKWPVFFCASPITIDRASNVNKRAQDKWHSSVICWWCKICALLNLFWVNWVFKFDLEECEKLSTRNAIVRGDIDPIEINVRWQTMYSWWWPFEFWPWNMLHNDERLRDREEEKETKTTEQEHNLRISHDLIINLNGAARFVERPKHPNRGNSMIYVKTWKTEKNSYSRPNCHENCDK